jgi:hypothetical protein
MAKIDHPPVYKEQAVVKHDMLEDTNKADEAGHKPHHNFFKEHAAGHKLHHENVASFCGGGMAKGKK